MNRSKSSCRYAENIFFLDGVEKEFKSPYQFSFFLSEESQILILSFFLHAIHLLNEKWHLVHSIYKITAFFRYNLCFVLLFDRRRY